MATINFYLRPEIRDSKNHVPIYLIYQDRGQKFKHFTGQKVHEDDWDVQNQLVKEHSPLAPEVNFVLNRHKKQLNDVISRIREEALPGSIDSIKTLFKKQYEESLPGNDFHKRFEEFIEKASLTRKPSTLVIYQSVLKDIRRFEHFTQFQIRFDTINEQFYDAFTRFLIEKLDNTNNTVSKKIKTLKVFLKHASENKLIDYSNYLKFKTNITQPTRIILTDQELTKIFNLNLSMQKELMVARDIFLFGCFTGLKFSEIIKLKNSDIQSRRLKVLNHYTNKEISVPMNNYAQMVLQRYENSGTYCFPQMNNVYANKFVKEIACMAGLDQLIEVDTHRGQEIHTGQHPKWKLITTETARFTFAALSLKAGMRPELLILLLGQKNINSLLQYTIDNNPMQDVEMVNCWNKKVF